jgi:hypothetical protein
MREKPLAGRAVGPTQAVDEAEEQQLVHAAH